MQLFASRETSQRRPFALLLSAQLLFLFLIPFLGEDDAGRRFLGLGFTGVVLAGVGIAVSSRRAMPVILALVVANVIAQWLAHFLLGEAVDQQMLKSGLGAIYLLALVVALLSQLARQTRVSLDTLLGGVNVFLLLAIAFAQVHVLVESARAGSYVSGGVSLSDATAHPHGSLHWTFLYFSFVTLTTLGYGDIAPARPVAQLVCAAEAVVGQLYVAILIGGLVALWIGGRRETRADGTTE